jgi:hypothetical protein
MDVINAIYLLRDAHAISNHRRVRPRVNRDGGFYCIAGKARIMLEHKPIGGMNHRFK